MSGYFHYIKTNKEGGVSAFALRNSDTIHRERGFTLIETFVAITILLMAIVGPLTLATRSLFSALVARDQLVASYLAQDAVEFVRYRRDSNFLAGSSWLSGDLSLCITPKVCQIDTANDTISECPNGVCPDLTYNDVAGIYGYGNGSGDNPTSFQRTVTLSPVVNNPGNEYTVDVKVSWQTSSFQNNFTSKESIYNWLGK